MLDSHAHYDDARFDGDRDALLTALFAEKTVTHIVNAAPTCRPPACARRFPSVMTECTTLSAYTRRPSASNFRH